MLICPQSPHIPAGADRRVCIPVEVKGDDDRRSLEEMQVALEDFGFENSTRHLAEFVNASPIFASALGSKIYPVLEPDNYYGIYQTWG